METLEEARARIAAANVQRVAAEVAERTAEAQRLVGRSIAAAQVIRPDAACDDVNELILTMTDGTVWRVVGGYGSYTGDSKDEYQMLVRVLPDV